MSFYDIRRVTYDRLQHITNVYSPYRGSTNAYQLGDRRYSARHFRKEKDGAFSIWYSDRETIDNKYGMVNQNSPTYTESVDYYDRGRLGVVHPDNTFEFVGGWNAQGSNMLLCHALDVWLHNDNSKGGLVYSVSNSAEGTKVYPVFKGLKIDLSTRKPVTPYKVFLPVVKRKIAGAIMAEYDEFRKTFPTMLKAMDSVGIWDVFYDIYLYGASRGDGGWRELDSVDVKKFIDEKKYVDAALMFATVFGGRRYTHRLWEVDWALKQNPDWDREKFLQSKQGRDTLPSHFVDSVVASFSKFRKEILKAHRDAFDYEEVPIGSVPSSQWGLQIRVNDELVQRL